MRVAVCHSEKNDCSLLKKMSADYAAANPQCHLEVLTFSSVGEMADSCDKRDSFDLVVAEGSAGEGITEERAHKLHRLRSNAEFVFITAGASCNDGHLNEKVLKYLPYPIKEEEFCPVIERAIRHVSSMQEQKIMLKTPEGYRKFVTAEIVYTEPGKHNYQLVHCADGSSVLVRGTATELFSLLTADRFFIRCGASYNINLKHIGAVLQGAVVFKNGAELKIPSGAYNKLLASFNNCQEED